MGWHFSPYVGLLAFAAVLSLGLARVAWHRRPAPGAAPCAVMLIGIAVWSGTYGLELAVPDIGDKLLLAKAGYLGIVTVPVAWLVFALHYTGRSRSVAGPRLAWLVAIPAITLALVWTNEAHGLVWSSLRLEAHGGATWLAVGHGWWFWVFAAYTYLLLAVASLLLVTDLIRSGFIYQAQGIALLAGTIAPWIANALYLARLTPVPDLDLTPFAFTLSGLALIWALYRYKLLDIVPVAYDMVVRDMADGVLVVNSDDRVVALNQAAATAVGAAPDAIGRPLDAVLAGQPDLIAALRAPEGRRELTLTADGVERYVDVLISPLRDPGGRLSGRIVILHDLTARRKSEANHLELLREQADRAEAESRLRTRNEVLSSLSHDLKNPLTTIRATSDLIGRRLADPRPEDRDRVLTGVVRINDSVDRMRTLLDDLVELTRLQLGQDIELDRRPTDLVALIRRVVADHRPAATSVALEFKSCQPSLIGNWDTARLDRVITNLVNNAIKYSPNGGRVRICLRREAEPGGDRAVLAVSDQGLGIPEEDLPRIFEWFYRAGNVADRIAGTGVGLASSRQIVEQHGGSLTVQSREGEGSTFTIRLPLEGADDACP